MKFITRSLVALILALIPLISLFDTKAEASYSFAFPITIQDTTNTSRTNLPVILSFEGSQLVNAGYTVNGLDTNMQSGSSNVSYMMDTSNVTVVLPNLPAGGSIPINLLTGYSPAQTYFPIIVGDGGNVTYLDNAALEPGANFSIGASGYIDTADGANKNIVYKSGAMSLAVSSVVSGNITGTVVGQTGLSQTLNVNGVGDLTNITSVFGAATHWQAVQTNDGDTSYVYVTGAIGAYITDTYAMDDGTIPSYAVIDSVVVHTVARVTGAGGNGGAKTVIRLGGVSVESATHSPLGAGYVDYSDSLARPGGGSWVVGDIANTQIGTSIINSGAGEETRVTQVYAVINYHYTESTVTASGVSVGVHTANMTANGTDLLLYVDGVLVDNQTLKNAVVDTPNDWVLDQNNVMPYITSYTETVGGVEKIHYQPNTMVVGTTLPNLDSGGLYPGTINFGTNTGINIVYGQQTSSQQVSVSSNVTPGYSVPAFNMPNTWFANGENLQKYQIGLASVITGNTTVLGVGTAWTSSLVGKVFQMNGDASSTVIVAVNSTGNLTLSTGYLYATAGPAQYTIMSADPPPFYDLFYDIASQAGVPVQTLYFIIVMPISFLAALLCIVYTKSAFIGVFVMTLSMFFASAATIVPMWIPFSLLVVDLGIMYLYRQITY